MSGNPPVSVLDFLRRAQRFLEAHGTPSPRLDAEVLLAHLLGCERIDLYAGFDRPLSVAETARYRRLIQERGRGVPVAYLTGLREFYSLPFRVTPDVLVPRPETEHLVEAALAHLAPGAPARVVDVGTGSGCVAIAVARLRPAAEVVAVDVCAAALAVAEDNARRLGVADRVHLLQADGLEALGAGPLLDLILSNPPYVPESERDALPRDVRDHEPAVALFAPGSGTGLHRRLAAAAPSRLAAGGALFLEIGAGQEREVAGLVEAAFGRATVIRDLAGIARVVGGKKL
ncbi:MAG: peptide chain release factor N(5)-glutamine methyltransferase [Planctomycetes bacterium]|nr:peptide chain release factor N(5)-glutamine methyltransferase [Planctomycetota bacterium]